MLHLQHTRASIKVQYDRSFARETCVSVRCDDFASGKAWKKRMKYTHSRKYESKCICDHFRRYAFLKIELICIWLHIRVQMLHITKWQVKQMWSGTICYLDRILSSVSKRHAAAPSLTWSECRQERRGMCRLQNCQGAASSDIIEIERAAALTLGWVKGLVASLNAAYATRKRGLGKLCSIYAYISER